MAGMLPLPPTHFTITGTTKDKDGVALGGVTIELFSTQTNLMMDQTVSDGSGNYTLNNVGGGTYYIAAYLAGSPDLAGASLNTLAGVAA